MRIYKLNKTVLSVKNNAAKFLNGITSNSLDKPQNAFLDFHGKIVAAFEQVKSGEDEFLIVVESSAVDALMAHLDKFIRLSKAAVTKEDWRVYFDLDGDCPTGHGEFVIPQRQGRIILTRRDLKSGITDGEFTLFRLKSHIPLHGIDYKDEMILNIGEEAVSFSKGCFLGQEFVAKVHSRSKPTWKLVVRSFDECDEEGKKKMTSRARDPETQKELGFVFVSNR